MTRGPLLKIQAPTAASGYAKSYAPGPKGAEEHAAPNNEPCRVRSGSDRQEEVRRRHRVPGSCSPRARRHLVGLFVHAAPPWEEKLAPEEKSAATAVVQWVLGPNEENRVTAQALAQAAGGGSPAGSLAMAVGLTGGSIAPPNAPPKPPPPFAAAPPIAMAVKIASTKTDPPIIAKMQRAYVELGLDVAEGRLI